MKASPALRARAKAVVMGLRTLYPDAHCELVFSNPLELAVATILSAQCTDKRVNLVTPALFRRCKTARDFASIESAELERLIRSTGFYRSKTKSIREMARVVVERFGGELPRTMAELLTLRGVARKTANVILGTAFGISEGIVVDTHVKRLSFRLGFTKSPNPVVVERDLMGLIHEPDRIFFGHALVWHGRRACFASKPLCSGCGLAPECPQNGVSVSV